MSGVGQQGLARAPPLVQPLAQQGLAQALPLVQPLAQQGLAQALPLVLARSEVLQAAAAALARLVGIRAQKPVEVGPL